MSSEGVACVRENIFAYTPPGGLSTEYVSIKSNSDGGAEITVRSLGGGLASIDLPPDELVLLGRALRPASPPSLTNEHMLSRAIRPGGFIEPCQPTGAKAPPSGSGWFHEIKHDGFRLLAFRDGDRVRLYTRNGHNWTTRFPLIARAVERVASWQVRRQLVNARDRGADAIELRNGKARISEFAEIGGNGLRRRRQVGQPYSLAPLLEPPEVSPIKANRGLTARTELHHDLVGQDFFEPFGENFSHGLQALRRLGRLRFRRDLLTEGRNSVVKLVARRWNIGRV